MRIRRKRIMPLLTFVPGPGVRSTIFQIFFQLFFFTFLSVCINRVLVLCVCARYGGSSQPRLMFTEKGYRHGELGLFASLLRME